MWRLPVIILLLVRQIVTRPLKNVLFMSVIRKRKECTGDPEEDTWYYKKINRQTFNIPLCDPNDENCEALVCPEGEEDCSETLCSDQAMDE